MCGIWGFASSVKIPRLEQVFIVLALANELRGKQSWGVTDGDEVIKDIGHVSDNLFRIPLMPKGIMVAHTRAATVGSAIKENAHPFRFETANGHPVIGVHNGGISNWKELNEKYDRDFDVDSMHIFAHIAKGLPLKELEGSGTIVYFKSGSLFFAKFNGGSLAMAKVKDAGLVFSSSEWAVRDALKGAGVDYKLYDLKENKIYYYADNGIFSSGEKIEISSRQQAMSLTRYGFNNHFHHYGFNKRVVKIRVISSSSPIEKDSTPLFKEPKQDETYQKNFFGLCEKLSIFTEVQRQCVVCHTQTFRVYVGETPHIPMCFDCLKIKVNSGEIDENRKSLSC